MKPWMSVLTGICIGLIAGALVYILVAPPRGTPVTLQPRPTLSPSSVQVAGEVVQPGVYQLPPDSRVQDAIQAAGGLTGQADSNSLNLAALVTDGQKIVVPALMRAADVTPGSKQGSLIIVQPTSDGRINLNLATLEQLDSLPGIGEAKARSILDYRAKNGPFTNCEQLLDVPGIGEGIYNSIREFIFVDSSTP